MLSSEEMSTVYGGDKSNPPGSASASGATPSGAAMPEVDDMGSGGELNPHSLEFEDISVGGSPSAQNVGNAGGSIGSMGSCGGGRASESASILRDDRTPKPSVVKVGSPTAGTGGSGAAGGADSGDGSSAGATPWQLAYYKPLFDVDSAHILTRVVHAVLPRPRAQFFEVIASNADLYGPFWIATTLVFVIGVTGNLAKRMAFKASEAQPTWTYDFTLLTGGSSAVYTYVTLAPLAAWGVLRYMQANKRLVDIVCLYGYSLATFVPVSLVCVVPSSALRWVVIALGCASSSAFILSNVYAHLQDCFPYSDSESMKRGYMLLAGMAVCHALFALVLKLCFF